MTITPETLAASGSESGHQKALFCRIAHMAAAHPDRYGMLAHLAFAIPNGGKRDPATAARMKAEGVKAGVWDIFIAVPRGNLCGLFIEMKKPEERTRKHGGLSDSQVIFQQWANAHCYGTRVAYTWQEAWEIIEEWMSL